MTERGETFFRASDPGGSNGSGGAGGRVTGVMVFEGDHHAYDDLGVVVSGSHTKER
ncbi:MAG: hypothetical protein IH786_06915 [Proteobacteria bacterium]|nr:hypothetical protein [Pseudomonadota bacterium]